MSAVHVRNYLLQHLLHLQSRGIRNIRMTEETKAAIMRKNRPNEGSPPRKPPSVNSAAAPQTSVQAETLAPIPNSKAERLRDLIDQAARCTLASSLGTLRDQMVFSTGSLDAPVVFLGEAPGSEEERKGEPFVGPAGKKLNQILKAMGLQRGDVYISNICKFRPKISDGSDQGTRNRKPSLAEMQTCLDFVKKEIAIVQPKIIVALGATAMEGLLGIKGSIEKERKTWHRFNDIPVKISFHPSFLLRSESNADGGKAEKRMVWEDMLDVMDRLGMQISEKQKNYFL